MSNKIARADVVGSLLRPDYLRQAKDRMREGTMDSGELRGLEDRAVLDAIRIQESAGIQAISDGEMRRWSWIAFIPLNDDPLFQAPVRGFEFLEADAGWVSLWKTPSGEKISAQTIQNEFNMSKQPFITSKLELNRDIVSDEYGFLKEHASARTKFNFPSPSWHRIFWHPEYSTAAYPTSDDFIAAVADFYREHIVKPLLSMGCDYIQLDAPNYSQWHIDPECRATFEQHGHDMAHELVADAEFDNRVFEGVSGISTGIHLCRGNGPRGLYLASGGYEAIAKEIFPRWSNINTLLLEYDSDRAGGFEPLVHTQDHQVTVLGLVTTKDAAMEQQDALVGRINEAARYVPLERLALSPQCGFASGEISDTMTIDQQQAKLELVGRTAEKVWGD
jgi:5-methyltetrahydropteroyltriglutamate--homocysteine methyltransferase